MSTEDFIANLGWSSELNSIFNVRTQRLLGVAEGDMVIGVGAGSDYFAFAASEMRVT